MGRGWVYCSGMQEREATQQATQAEKTMKNYIGSVRNVDEAVAVRMLKEREAFAIYGTSETMASRLATAAGFARRVAWGQVPTQFSCEDGSRLVAGFDCIVFVPAERNCGTLCHGCGHVNPHADNDGAVEGPREWHADCWAALTDEEQDAAIASAR